MVPVERIELRQGVMKSLFINDLSDRGLGLLWHWNARFCGVGKRDPGPFRPDH